MAYADGDGHDWDAAYDAVRGRCSSAFADVHSLALQQSLWEMGRAVLETLPEIGSIELVAPQQAPRRGGPAGPSGSANDGEVFHADRPARTA